MAESRPPFSWLDPGAFTKFEKQNFSHFVPKNLFFTFYSIGVKFEELFCKTIKNLNLK